MKFSLDFLNIACDDRGIIICILSEPIDLMCSVRKRDKNARNAIKLFLCEVKF